MLELYQPIVNFGVLVVIAAMYLWQTPKTIEKITKVIESNTSVIKDSKTYHERMEAAGLTIEVLSKLAISLIAMRGIATTSTPAII